MTRLSIRAPRAWLGRGQMVDDVQVVCEDGAIVYAGPWTDGETAEREVVVDGTLLPAAADRHVHIGLSDPLAVLQRGVAAVRDLGWPAEHVFPLADLSEMPSFDGPLIRAAGPILTAPGGYPMRAAWAPEGTGLPVADAEEAATAIRGLAARGATAVKVSLNDDEGPVPGDAVLAAIVDAAHDAELPVTAHAQGEGQVERALGAGVDELAHTPWLRLRDDTIRRCAASVRIVSTLAIHGLTADSPALGVALDNLRRFHAAGGTVIYGTDLGNGPIPPGIVVRELLLLLEAGLTHDEVLTALVRAPLEPGAPADLICTAGDPLRSLTAFDELRLVVRGGRVVPA